MSRSDSKSLSPILLHMAAWKFHCGEPEAKRPRWWRTSVCMCAKGVSEIWGWLAFVVVRILLSQGCCWCVCIYMCRCLHYVCMIVYEATYDLVWCHLLAWRKFGLQESTEYHRLSTKYFRGDDIPVLITDCRVKQYVCLCVCLCVQ